MAHSKRERRNQTKEPFEPVDSAVANGQCKNGTKVGRPHITACPRCEIRVALHCTDCKLQITACLCSEYKRFGNDVAWKRAVERWGEQAARERAEAAGLWLPPQR